MKRNVTARDVAAEARVSTATVSYVLSNRPDKSISQSTRERVVQAARRLNYRHNAHAADLARGATRIVGICLPSVGYPILLRKLAALERGLRKAGYFPSVCHAMDLEAEQAFFDECASRCVRGLVLMSLRRSENHSDVRSLIAKGAVVVSSEPIPELDIPYVTVDRGAGAEAAVRHLLALGHQRIAAIEGFGGPLGRDFLSGYCRGLAGGGVPFDAELVVELVRGGSAFEKGERTVERWFDRLASASAILTTDDEAAIGALRALRRRGRRVPDDVALVGYDDLPVAAYAEVPLTTLAQPAEAMGTRLAELFLEGLADPRQIVGQKIALPPRLILRESCGAARRTIKEEDPS
jgi:DNA-binding LacI/PurR family transcriptional regulator